MITEPFDGTTGLDRFATNDEVQAALSSLPGFFVECHKDKLWEVESDMGGSILIETESQEMLTLLEALESTAN